ncbi:MAG: hypothetical protein ABI775_02905 [Pseudonocardiales bacterium]
MIVLGAGRLDVGKGLGELGVPTRPARRKLGAPRSKEITCFDPYRLLWPRRLTRRTPMLPVGT